MSVTKVEDEHQQREKLYQLLIVALVGVLVMTLVAVVWLLQGKNSAQDERDQAEDDNAAYAAGPDAQAAAERILGEMISFSHKDIADEYTWTEYLSDDDLRSDYEKRIIPRLKKVIRTTKASAQGEIVQSAYNIVDEDEVTVLAFIRQRLKDARNRRGVADEQWASLTMTRDGDDWLIDRIDIVSVPPPS